MSTFGLLSQIPSSPSDSTNVFIQAAEGNLPYLQSTLPSLGKNHADPNGYTCLHAAAAYGRDDVVKYLLDNGNDVNVPDSDGDTPLHHCESAKTAALLVERGAGHLALNAEGKCPLEAKIEEQVGEGDEDYDSDDDEQTELKFLLGYLMTLPYPEKGGGGEGGREVKGREEGGGKKRRGGE